MTTKRFLLVASAMALVLLLTVPGAAAFETRTGQEVVIEAGRTIPDDLYVVAQTVRIDGTVQGDVVAAGRDVIVSGVVEGDLIAASQSTVISGSIGDDARGATMAFTLTQGAAIGDDLMGAGFSFDALHNTSIGGAALVAGAQARFAGEIAEDLKAATNGLVVDGVVGGDVEAVVGGPGRRAPVSPQTFVPNAPAMPSIPSGLSLGPNAEVRGDLSYRSAREVQIPTGAVAGSVDFRREVADTVQAPAQPTLVEQVLDRDPRRVGASAGRRARRCHRPPKPSRIAAQLANGPRIGTASSSVSRTTPVSSGQNLAAAAPGATGLSSSRPTRCNTGILVR